MGSWVTLGRGWSPLMSPAITTHVQELWSPPVEFLSTTYLPACLIMGEMTVTIVHQTCFCGQKMIRDVDFPVSTGEMRLYPEGSSYLVSKLTGELHQAGDNTACWWKIKCSGSVPVLQSTEHHRAVPSSFKKKKNYYGYFCGCCRIFFKGNKYSEIRSWDDINAVT